MHCQKTTSERRNLLLFLVQRHRCDSRIQSKPYSYRVQRVYNSGQIIATSYHLTPKGSKRREIPLFQGNLGWWNIAIWPDSSKHFMFIIHFQQVNPFNHQQHMACARFHAQHRKWHSTRLWPGILVVPPTEVPPTDRFPRRPMAWRLEVGTGIWGTKLYQPRSVRQDWKPQ